ncbi:MAG: hypothetical protein EOP09_19190 [Proteobacteria bacterium]|nr:MAG: hypothetical protein EOP09_19190 [Pseudomonadota bacterium]
MQAFTDIYQFGVNHGMDWQQMNECPRRTVDKHEQLISSITQSDLPFASSDADLVVFGSIARQECTDGSDVDWTLLVDGQFDPTHLILTQQVRQSLEPDKKPGTSGLFGQNYLWS